MFTKTLLKCDINNVYNSLSIAICYLFALFELQYPRSLAQENLSNQFSIIELFQIQRLKTSFINSR